MKTVTIKNDYEQAVEAFNNELNDYFEREIENVRHILAITQCSVM